MNPPNSSRFGRWGNTSDSDRSKVPIRPSAIDALPVILMAVVRAAAGRAFYFLLLGGLLLAGCRAAAPTPKPTATAPTPRCSSCIAFTSVPPFAGASVTIWVMDSDGAHARELRTERSVNSLPVWSPDGSQIAFASDRSGGRGSSSLLEHRGSLRGGFVTGRVLPRRRTKARARSEGGTVEMPRNAGEPSAYHCSTAIRSARPCPPSCPTWSP